MMELDFTDLIGKPFDPDGYGPDNYSCYGLTVEVFRRYGITIPRTNMSVCACKQASMEEIEKHAKAYWQEIKTPVAPCGVLIRSVGLEYAHHIGVYIGRGKMIHVTAKRAAVIDKIYNWKNNIIGYYKYVGHSC